LVLGSAVFAQTSYHAILTGGRIVDGTGNAWLYGDLAIRDSRIARIVPAGVLRNAATRERIDVSGLIVAPGPAGGFAATAARFCRFFKKHLSPPICFVLDLS
jgi:hypothetical protein